MLILHFLKYTFNEAYYRVSFLINAKAQLKSLGNKHQAQALSN